MLPIVQAIDVLLNKVKYKDIHKHLLDEIDLKVLQDIANFLKIPHAVQTLLCAERTPTLATVLPAYEDLLEMLRNFKIIPIAPSRQPFRRLKNMSTNHGRLESML